MPDVVVVLGIPVRASFSRKSRRRDLHESDNALLLRVRRAYLRLAGKYTWRVVNGAGPAVNVGQETWESLGGPVTHYGWNQPKKRLTSTRQG